MAKFAYNNTKNINIGYMPFKLNYNYYPWILYKEDVDFCSKSKIADKLSTNLES